MIPIPVSESAEASFHLHDARLHLVLDAQEGTLTTADVRGLGGVIDRGVRITGADTDPADGLDDAPAGSLDAFVDHIYAEDPSLSDMVTRSEIDGFL